MTFVDEGTETPEAGLESGVAPVVEEAPGGAPTEPTGDEPSHTIVWNGEERQVSQSELIDLAQQGYDYTQKTQSLAQERAQLENAAKLYAHLNEDPERTLRVLSESFGVSIGATAATGEEEPEELDPEEQWRGRVEEFMESQRMQALQQEVLGEISGLQQRFGDFEAEGLLRFAADNRIANLETAYRAWKFDEVASERTAEEQRAAEDQAIQDRKRGAPPVAGGSSNAAGSVVSGGAAPVTSTREAWELAKQQLGMD